VGEQQQQHHDDIGCAVRKGQSIRQAGRQACMRAKCACTTQHRPPPPPPPLSAVSVWSIPQKERYYCWGQATKCSCAAVFAPQQRPSPPPSRNATHTHTYSARTRVCAWCAHTHATRSPLAGSERRRHQQAERERERGGATTKPCMHAAAARPRGCCSGGGTCQQHHHTQPTKAITPWCPCGRVVMTGRP
jgi:hypothetical protein